MIPPTIETERLVLRALTAADANVAYLAWMQDTEVIDQLEIRFSGVKTTDELWTFIEGVNAGKDSYLFGIFLKPDMRHIGNIKLGPIVREHARSEIGYLIGDRQSWGRGYASEAIRAVARFGLDELGLEKIKAGCYDANIGSAKALLKAGFEHEATIPADNLYRGRRVGSLMFGLNR